MGSIEEQTKTSNYLKKLGFKINSMGFNYWILAIELYSRNATNFEIFTITQIYEEIAEIYHTNKSSVERCMRTSRMTANENIKQKFNYNNKITNYTCLKLLVL